jgi:O-antigen/teichoic acid export membrane protein
MLAAMTGDHAVGIYNSAYRFLDMAVIVAVMLSTPMIPILSKLALGKREVLVRHYSRILELLTSIIVPLAILVPLVSGPFVHIVFGPEYAEVVSLLNLMAWIGVLTFFSMFNFVVLLAVKVVRFQIWLGVVTALLNVLLNYLLIPHFSYYGSAWATLLVEGLFVLVSSIYVLRSVGNIFKSRIWLRVALISLIVLIAANSTHSLDFSWRIAIATSVWLGSLFIFKIPLNSILSR